MLTGTLAQRIAATIAVLQASNPLDAATHSPHLDALQAELPKGTTIDLDRSTGSYVRLRTSFFDGWTGYAVEVTSIDPLELTVIGRNRDGAEAVRHAYACALAQPGVVAETGA